MAMARLAALCSLLQLRAPAHALALPRTAAVPAPPLPLRAGPIMLLDHQPTLCWTVSRRALVPQVAAASAALIGTWQNARLASAANLPQSNGASSTNRGKVEALVPIICASTAMSAAAAYVKSSVDVPNLKAAQAALTEVPVDERSFKRMFDEYSTGISYKQQYLDKNAFLVYYTKGFDGPDRPSIETEGEQETVQKAQYGARNDAWLALDDFRSQVSYLLGSSTIDKEDVREIQATAAQANAAFASYLATAPPDDVAAALQMCARQ